MNGHREYPLEFHVGWGDDFQETIEVSMLYRDDRGAPVEAIVSMGGVLDEIIHYKRTRVGFMKRQSAQWLMDRLWGLGIRPSDESTPGQFAAQGAHLQDMQMIAFRLIDHVLGGKK